MSSSAEARSILAEALEVEVEEIDDGATIFTLEAWDSLAHMRLVAVLERELGRPLEAHEIVGLASLGDVNGLIGN